MLFCVTRTNKMLFCVTRTNKIFRSYLSHPLNMNAVLKLTTKAKTQNAILCYEKQHFINLFNSFRSGV